MTYISTSDLEPFATIESAKAQAMIEDAVAQAVLVAPCLSDPSALTPAQVAAVRAILRSAILRWNDSGAGAFSQETAGPFSVSLDTRQARRSLFWPSEIGQLEAICTAINGGGGGQAFAVNTAPAVVRHGPRWWGYEVGNWPGPDISVDP